MTVNQGVRGSIPRWGAKYKNFMIYLEKNFITDDQCNYLISWYNQNQDKSYQYRDTYPIKLANVDDKIIINIISKINLYAHNLVNFKMFVNNVELVKWPVGSSMPKHRDPNDDVFAGLIFLNDNFLGGCTEFANQTIQPKKGSFVIFLNSLLEHCVTKIENNDRYTFAIWFTRSE